MLCVGKRKKYEEMAKCVAREWVALNAEYPQLSEWRVGVNSAKRRLGVCKYGKKVIEVSVYVLQRGDEKQVLNTLRHEVAHALLPVGEGHSRRWRALHKKLGGDGERCTDMELCDAYKWVLWCKNGCVVAKNRSTGEELREIRYFRKPKKGVCRCGAEVAVERIEVWEEKSEKTCGVSK